jgi:hypothetical protein
MESEENQKQVFPPFPPPLEIAAAISTFPPRRGLLPLSKRKINPKNQNRKEFSRYRPPYFRSGSFFDENMLEEKRSHSRLVSYRVGFCSTRSRTTTGNVGGVDQNCYGRVR